MDDPNQAPWYVLTDVVTIDTPAFVVYPERVKANIRAIRQWVDPARLRPHVKTHKLREVAVLQMDEGITRFKCATIAEAEMLGLVGAPDVLLAYQPVGPKISRLLSLVQGYPQTRFSCLVDHPAAARTIAAAAADRGLNLPVFIDLNVGMNRTGILPGADALDLYEQCNSLTGVQAVGLHVYDGHIRQADAAERAAACREAFMPVLEMKEELIRRGYRPTVVAGGSTTFLWHAEQPDVECSPGTFVYWDAGYEQLLPDQGFHSAAVVVTRVVSLPSDRLVCCDLGHKSVAAENEVTNRVVLLNAPDLKVVSQSEEHLVLEAPAGHSYGIGDVLYGVPVHVCPTAALYEQALVAEDGTITGAWRTLARDRAISL
ncbi:MAG TPA: D-TA family PLP-dependent enzyme [Chitinophagaceae bacterium]|jgi:D-serine deaminase-like pyridoxal phosphate-dependent protein|nr:D-TA family PLP-dependent enzyme [Chitinophagaceae bacterium]